MVELRRGLVDAEFHSRAAREAALAALAGEDLDDTVAGIRAVERGGRAARHVFDVVNVLHRDVGDGARGGGLAVYVAAEHGLGELVGEGGAGVEIVHSHAVHIDDGGGIDQCRRQAARLNHRCGAGLAAGYGELNVGEQRLQLLVETAAGHVGQL